MSDILKEFDFSDELIKLAIKEDLTLGDVSSEYFVPKLNYNTVQAQINARENLVVSGVKIVKKFFQTVSKNIEVKIIANDGTKIAKDSTIIEISGPAREVLSHERIALNFLQHLSGIATLTNTFVEKISHTKAKILDTRKTLPGYRFLQKKAVKDGGGNNHRFCLGDAVMIKDNHLAGTGGDIKTLQEKINYIRREKPDIKIEIEADTLEQVKDFLQLKGLQVILLDNMDLVTMREAISFKKKHGVKFEASGGISLDNVAEVAEVGVDFISIGMLTHSARTVDLGLDFAL